MKPPNKTHTAKVNGAETGAKVSFGGLKIPEKYIKKR
jgi:hypothetical protein